MTVLLGSSSPALLTALTRYSPSLPRAVCRVSQSPLCFSLWEVWHGPLLPSGLFRPSSARITRKLLQINELKRVSASCNSPPRCAEPFFTARNGFSAQLFRSALRGFIPRDRNIDSRSARHSARRGIARRCEQWPRVLRFGYALRACRSSLPPFIPRRERCPRPARIHPSL